METSDPVQQLYDLAARHGVTMAEICERAEVAPTTPSRWRNDRNGATFKTLAKLNTALGSIIADRSRSAEAA